MDGVPPQDKGALEYLGSCVDHEGITVEMFLDPDAVLGPAEKRASLYAAYRAKIFVNLRESLEDLDDPNADCAEIMHTALDLLFKRESEIHQAAIADVPSALKLAEACVKYTVKHLLATLQQMGRLQLLPACETSANQWLRLRRRKLRTLFADRLLAETVQQTSYEQAVLTPRQPDPTKPKRGRPPLPKENKKRALEAKNSGKTNREVASLLYGTSYPTEQHIKSVHSILKHYQKNRDS